MGFKDGVLQTIYIMVFLVSCPINNITGRTLSPAMGTKKGRIIKHGVSKWHRFGTAAAGAIGTAVGTAVGKWATGGFSKTKGSQYFPKRRFGVGGRYTRRRAAAKRPILPNKFQKEMMPVRIWRNTDADRLTCNVAQQGGASFTVGAQADLNQAFDILDDAGNPTAYAYIDSISGEYRITNQDSGNCELKIYDIVPRYNMDASQPYQPVSCWDTGLTNTNGSSTTTKAMSNLGSVPYDSPDFCRYFKVLGVKRVILGAGQSHVHKFNYKFKKVISRRVYADYLIYRNLTKYCMFVVSGMPYNDKTTVTNVACGTCAIDIVKIARIKYRGINNQPNYYQYTNGQDTITVEQQMDMDGDKQDDVQA